jgi:hypothetical protein
VRKVKEVPQPQTEEYEIEGFGEGDEDLMVDSGDDLEDVENNQVVVEKRESLREIREKKRLQQQQQQQRRENSNNDRTKPKKPLGTATNTQHSNGKYSTKGATVNQKMKEAKKRAAREQKRARKKEMLQRQTKKELVEEKKQRNQRIDARATRMRQDVGKRLSIYSSKYDEWSQGEIVEIDAERRMHCVQYDDDERRWHRMDLLKFSIVD